MINLRQLYTGFINSYNSLLLPAGDEENIAQDTHAIIEWFRRTGISLGFYPRCEAKKRDLEWCDRRKKAILHLESENYYSRVGHTIKKLLKSDVNYRIGLIWTSDTSKNISKNVGKIAIKSKGKKWKMLLIFRFVGEETGKFPVMSWFISRGKAKKLKMSYIVWQKEKEWGYQITRRLK